MQPVFFPNQLATSLLLQPSYLFPLPSSTHGIHWVRPKRWWKLTNLKVVTFGNLSRGTGPENFWGRTKGWKTLGFLPKKNHPSFEGVRKKIDLAPKTSVFFCCCCCFSVFGNSLGCDLKKTLAQKL